MALYSHDIDACLSGRIGPAGVAQDELTSYLAKADAALQIIRGWHSGNSLPLLNLPARRDDIRNIEPIAENICESFDDLIVLGTGGSSLGGQTLCALAGNAFASMRGTPPAHPRVHFMDNIDPHTFELLFREIDPARTGFLVISKSGGTAETLMQFLYCLSVFKQVIPSDRFAQHFIVITEPGSNPLRDLASSHGFHILDHDPDVGGRFSVLSIAGLLPAMVSGLDVETVRDGAASVLDPILSGAGATDTPAALGAAVTSGLSEKHGISASVLMPYVDRLKTLGAWYRQLWAESLGKGGNGTTPIDALGTVDQHSQLQLYLGGPADKMYTIIQGNVAGTGGKIDAETAKDQRIGYLRDRRMGDLLDAEQRATTETLIRNNRPTRCITLSGIDESVIGALLMHFMLETIIAAHLIGVDAFDQPAVEEGKLLARQYLGEGISQ